jgi:hypothetical protein
MGSFSFLAKSKTLRMPEDSILRILEAIQRSGSLPPLIRIPSTACGTFQVAALL